MCKKYSLLIIYFFLSTAILAQITIEGKLSLSDSSPAVGGFVTLVSVADSMSMLDFSATKDDGSWAFSTSLNGKVLLKAAYIGHETYLQTIDLKENDSLYIEIKLKEKIELIENIEVVARAIDIVQKGDTIKYHVKNFLTGSEQTLGDVLQKLPGFEVDANGTITYNGQKIDKLLVEGKDILNNQHQLATEGISAEDLLNIEIINKYTDTKEQFSNASSDKIALNIDLDNDGKASWNTNVALGGGYDKKYKIAVNSIGITKKLGVTLFAKANNTGEEVLTANDYFNLQTERNLLASMNSILNGIDGILPKSFYSPSDLQQNKDGLFAANLSYEPSDKLEIKTSLLTVNFNRISGNDFVRTYIGNEQVFVGQSQEQSKLPLLEWQSSLQYQLGKYLFLELDIPFSFQKENIIQTKKGFFNQDLMQINSRETTLKWHAFPQLYVDFKLNEKTHLIGKYAFQKQKNTNNLNLNGQDTLLNINLLAIQQQQNFQTSANFLDLLFRHNIKKMRLGIDYKFSDKIQNLTFLSTPFISTYQGETKLKTTIHHILPYLQFENKHWYFRVGMNVDKYEFELNDSLDYQAFWINPAAVMRYNFSKLHFIVLSANQKNTEQPLTNLTSNYQIQNAQTIYQGVLYPNQLPQINTFSLTYLNFNIITQTNFNIVLNYSKSLNVIGNQTIRQPNFIIIQPIIQPYQDNFNGRISINKKILDGKLVLQTVLNTQRLNGTVIQQNQINEWQYVQNALTISLEKKEKKALNYSLGVTLNQQQQTFTTLEITNYFNNVQPLLTVDFHKNNWTIKSDCRYLLSSNNLNRNELINWNMKIIYQTKDKPYTVSLLGNNLLNLNEKAQIQSNFNSIFVELESFKLFPGFIAAVLKYNF
jgi:hypothetical protein